MHLPIIAGGDGAFPGIENAGRRHHAQDRVCGMLEVSGLLAHLSMRNSISGFLVRNIWHIHYRGAGAHFRLTAAVLSILLANATELDSANPFGLTGHHIAGGTPELRRSRGPFGIRSPYFRI